MSSTSSPASEELQKVLLSRWEVCYKNFASADQAVNDVEREPSAGRLTVMQHTFISSLRDQLDKNRDDFMRRRKKIEQ